MVDTASYPTTERAKERDTVYLLYCASPHSRTMDIPSCEEAL